MKPSLTYFKNHLVCVGAALLLVLSVRAAKAQILLIDDSNPDAVVITATTGTATATQDIGLSDGFELLQFFTQSTGQNYDVTANAGSTLTGLTTTDVVTNAFGDDYTATGGYVDLNLFNPNSNDNLDFTQGSQAFTGTLVLDLQGKALPTNGSTGTVQTGFYDDGQNQGVPITTIGTYEVVNPSVSAPEPSTWILIGVSLLGWAIYRFRLRLVRVAGK